MSQNRFLLHLFVWFLLSGSVLGKGLPDTCTTACSQPYGKVLGKSFSNVQAYSNCSSDCVFPEPNKLDDIFTGIKWQCVEYARRWLLVNFGMVYGDVDYAIDIWETINFYTHVLTDERVPVESYPNGSESPPKRGDLLIYAKSLFGTGHVAVVVKTDFAAGKVFVAEQNYLNQPWPDSYSRSLELIHRDGRYWLLDSYLIGWKKIAKKDTS